MSARPDRERGNTEELLRKALLHDRSDNQQCPSWDSSDPAKTL